MSLGDLLEIVASCSIAIGTLLLVASQVSWLAGAGAALVVLCPCLAYLGQVWASLSISRPESD